MKSYFALAGYWFAISQLACNGSEPVSPADASSLTDATERPDAQAACLVPPAYEELAPSDAFAWYYGGPPIYWLDLVDESNDIFLALDLRSNRGSFSEEIATGTYAITGDDLDPDACGICLRMSVEQPMHPGYPEPRQCYFATGGTLTLDSITDRFTGSMEQVTFRPIECQSHAPLALDCSSRVGILDFDGEIIDGVD